MTQEKKEKKCLAVRAVIHGLSHGQGGLQLDYAVMLVNEAETAVE